MITWIHIEGCCLTVIPALICDSNPARCATRAPLRGSPSWLNFFPSYKLTWPSKVHHPSLFFSPFVSLFFALDSVGGWRRVVRQGVLLFLFFFKFSLSTFYMSKVFFCQLLYGNRTKKIILRIVLRSCMMILYEKDCVRNLCDKSSYIFAKKLSSISYFKNYALSLYVSWSWKLC